MHGKRGLQLWIVALAWGLGSSIAVAQTPAVTSTTRSAPAPSIVPVSDFIRPPDVSQVRISPDGKYLSALVPRPGNPHENLLAILDRQTAAVLRLIPSGKNALIADYFWVGNERLVAAGGWSPSIA